MMAGLDIALTAPQRAIVQRAAWLLGAALLLGGALVALAAWQHTRAVAARDAELLAVQQARATAEALRALRTTPGAREARVLALRRAGFTTPARRVEWAEGVTAALTRLRPLGYALEVGAERGQSLPPAVQAWFDARGVAPPPLRVTELTLSVQGLHEQELLDVLAAAHAAGAGLVRLEQCKIERRSDGIGLDASCRLRRFALRLLDDTASEALP